MNHLELCDDYFESVLPEMEPGDQSIIIDNFSQPPLPFAFARPARNLGFSGGCNLGLNLASADAICFLNNDVELGRRGWLEEIRQLLEPGVLVGPLRNGPHTVVDGMSYPYLDGWLLSGMRHDLLQLGGFDATLEEPAYYSDNLLCLEARARGMTLRGVRPGLRHLENTTAGPAHDQRVREASAANKARYEARVRELLVAA